MTIFAERKESCVALAAAVPYELGGTALTVDFFLYPVYLRGQAYLAAKEGGLATTEFQKILDHRSIVINEPIGGLAHLGIARAYAMQGETDKAKGPYQNFLLLWKDADPDIPILRQAKAEFANVKGRELSGGPHSYDTLIAASCLRRQGRNMLGLCEQSLCWTASPAPASLFGHEVEGLHPSCPPGRDLVKSGSFRRQ